MAFKSSWDNGVRWVCERWDLSAGKELEDLEVSMIKGRLSFWEG